jgi:iron complex transport system substrate-binding protein
MRIVTLVPSATEIVGAIGLAGDIVAVSHECDEPPEVRTRPRIVRTVIDAERLTSGEIHGRVLEALRAGDPLYVLDAEALAALRPDLVITQDLCEVCALPGVDIDAALAGLPRPPRVLRLHPHSLEDVLGDVLRVGVAAGREAAAQALVARLRARLARVGEVVAARPRPRVVCLEWLDPPFCAGHWMPEAVAIAGGREALGISTRPSFELPPGALAAADPEVLVLILCGFDVARTAAEWQAVSRRPEWQTLGAVRAGRVYATDAARYFSRSGPRIVDGIEMLAALLHPEAGLRAPAPDACVRLGGGKPREHGPGAAGPDEVVTDG